MTAALAPHIPHPGRPDRPTPRSALIVDDSEFDRMKLRRLIEATDLSFDLVEADSLSAMDTALDAGEFDLVLIDFFLVDNTGFEALQLLSRKSQKVPVSIMVTGDEQAEIAVQAIKMGCADYLSKATLTAESLKLAISEAESSLGIWQRQHEDRLKAVEALTGTMASRYSNSVRPELERIVRELRQVQSELATAKERHPDRLQDVERRCGELWSLLRDPETYRRRHH
jgi:CheY-like chemotaxis protein